MTVSAHHRNLALLVATCFFMENLDATIVTTAAPRLGAALHVPATSVSLLITCYLMTFATGIPVGGWLVVRFGSRRVFIGAIGLFTLASLFCALSGSFGELVVARTLQGVGAAMMVPVGRIVVLADAAKSDILRLVAYVVWPGLLAPVIAPFVGGVIVTFASWPWLFLLNVPVGVAALLAALKMMPRGSTVHATRARLDAVGMSLTCVALGGLVYSAYVASESATSWSFIGAVGVASVAVLGAAVAHLRRTRAPFLDLGVLGIRSLRDSILGLALFTVSTGPVTMLLPLLFQDHFGWSPIRSGSIVLCVFVGNIVIKPATTPLLNRVGHRRVLIGTTLGVALTMAAFALVGASTSFAVIVVIALVNGAFRSIGYSAYMTLAYADVHDDHMAGANVMAATTQQIFAGFAIAASVVALRIGSSITHVEGHPANWPLSFRFAFVIFALIAGVASVQSYTMHPSTGQSLRAVARRT